MIRYVTGDLFSANAEALVNAVNTVGVMGKGVALAFRQRFPENFRAYVDACSRGEVEVGRMFVMDRGGFQRPRLDHQLPDETALAASIQAGVDSRGPGRSSKGDRGERYPHDRDPGVGRG